MITGDPQCAFDTIERIRGMLALPFCRERAVVKAQKEQAARLVALLQQSIPWDISQQRARSEVPILANWLKQFLTPVTHKKYSGGRSVLGSFVGKSLLRIESVLREEYIPKQRRKV
jgi:hypothetical protein